MKLSDLPEDSKRIFEFLLKHLRTKESFTKEEMLGVVEGWSDETKKTYWSKMYNSLLHHLPNGLYRIREVFRKYTTEKKFRNYISQSRGPRTNYQKLDYDKLIIFEFYMPLMNEGYLRDCLDNLFYKDTVLVRLKNVIAEEKLKKYFPKDDNEGKEEYYNRVCEWISRKFIGYSIAHVKGRFRSDKIQTLSEAAEMQKIGQSYLIDETTAVVKFIFPIGEPKRKVHRLEGDINKEKNIKREVGRITWLFNELFVSNMVELVGEDQIWMVESGIRNRLHIWAIEED